eukprot:356639-Chlamydomonas_euryale.AAC.3
MGKGDADGRMAGATGGLVYWQGRRRRQDGGRDGWLSVLARETQTAGWRARQMAWCIGKGDADGRIAGATDGLLYGQGIRRRQDGGRDGWPGVQARERQTAGWRARRMAQTAA